MSEIKRTFILTPILHNFYYILNIKIAIKPNVGLIEFNISLLALGMCVTKNFGSVLVVDSNRNRHR